MIRATEVSTQGFLVKEEITEYDIGQRLLCQRGKGTHVMDAERRFGCEMFPGGFIPGKGNPESTGEWVPTVGRGVQLHSLS